MTATADRESSFEPQTLIFKYFPLHKNSIPTAPLCTGCSAHTNFQDLSTPQKQADKTLRQEAVVHAWNYYFFVCMFVLLCFPLLFCPPFFYELANKLLWCTSLSTESLSHYISTHMHILFFCSFIFTKGQKKHGVVCPCRLVLNKSIEFLSPEEKSSGQTSCVFIPGLSEMLYNFFCFLSCTSKSMYKCASVVLSFFKKYSTSYPSLPCGFFSPQKEKKKTEQKADRILKK